MNEIKTGDDLTQSLDLVFENVKKLKELFPEIVTEGKIDFKVLQNILGKQKNGKRMRLMGYHPTKSFGGRKKLTNPKYKKETGYTVKSFMEQHPKGNYFMIVKGHALALVDGILYGNSDEQYNGFRRQVHYVIKCQ